MKYIVTLFYALYTFSADANTLYFNMTQGVFQDIHCSVGDTVRYSTGGPYDYQLDIYGTQDTTNIGGVGMASFVIQGDELGYYMRRLSPNGFSLGSIYIDAVGINESVNLREFRFMPNPAIDKLTITSNQVLGEIAILNLEGKEVIRVVSINEKEIIEIANFEAGVYIISLEFHS